MAVRTGGRLTVTESVPVLMDSSSSSTMTVTSMVPLAVSGPVAHSIRPVAETVIPAGASCS